MIFRRKKKPQEPHRTAGAPRRRGAIVVLSAFLLVVMFVMLAFSIDIGHVCTLRTEIQRAADSGAFAGAGQLAAGPKAAIDAAHQFTQQNLVGQQTINDGDIQVEVGEWNTDTKTFTAGGKSPWAVKVTAQQNDLPLFFGAVIGQNQVDVRAEAIATYRPRDIMVVLDYSGSMNDDSELSSIGKLGRKAIETNLQEIYNELGAPNFGLMKWAPAFISSTNNTTISNTLGLRNVPYPYPSGSWDDYFNYVKSDGSVKGAGYQQRYGYLTLVNYWLQRQPKYSQTPDLWQTSEQPITAVKDAVKLFLAYLQEVETNDRVGLAIYTSSDGKGKLEVGLTQDYQEVEDISRQRQAAHYDNFTNIGAGMQIARQELENNGRPGALKMIVLMTDGIANRPGGTKEAREFVRSEAQLASKAGFPIVTVSLGAGADKALMQEVADATSGVHFNIPGGKAVAEYEEDLKEVFREIADDRPLQLVQ